MKQRSPEQRIALLELEHAWEKERQQYLVYRRNARPTEPQDRRAMGWVAAVIYLGIVIAPLFTEYTVLSGLSLVVGGMLFLPGIFVGISETAKARAYAEAKKSFEQKRARLLED